MEQSYSQNPSLTPIILGATVFWMNSGAGTELTVAGFLEQFQIRRDGGRRGMVAVGF